MSKTILPAFLTLLAAASSHGAILSVDFGTGTSPVETGFVRMSAGADTFSVTGPTSGSLTVTFPESGTRDRSAPSDSGTFTYGDLYRDLFTGLQETSTGTTFSISGLDPSTAYTIRIWSMDRGFNDGSVYEWYNTTGGGSVSLGTIVNSTSVTPPASNTDFSVFGAVTSDGSGMLTFGHVDPSGTGTINGFVLDVIPEPSVALLLGGLGFLAFRRRI